MKIWLLLLAFVWHDCFAATPTYATRVLVVKSKHEMYVFAGSKTIATYHVALGVYPVGPKQREGDRRTPEGRYVLVAKNPKSAFFKSIRISYPNDADVARAKKLGVSAGGDIMVHGQPNSARIRLAIKQYPYPDWTDGCIALSNADMQALWDMVRVPIPIEIVP